MVVQRARTDRTLGIIVAMVVGRWTSRHILACFRNINVHIT